MRTQHFCAFAVVEHDQPGRSSLALEPAGERDRRSLTLDRASRYRTTRIMRVELQRVCGLSSKPPYAGVRILVLIGVLQRELCLADAAHAVQRGRDDDGGPACSMELSTDLRERSVRIAKVRAQP